jgi:uncharacterized protein YjfI (DUF2170 family)
MEYDDDDETWNILISLTTTSMIVETFACPLKTECSQEPFTSFYNNVRQL